MMTDVLHATYRELSDEEKALMAQVKDKAQELHALYERVAALAGEDRTKGRPVSLAKTELESSVMWAIKGLTA